MESLEPKTCLQLDERVRSRVHIVSYYALTRSANKAVKEAFLQELDNTISLRLVEE